MAWSNFSDIFEIYYIFYAKTLEIFTRKISLFESFAPIINPHLTLFKSCPATSPNTDDEGFVESHVVNAGSNGGASNALYRQNSELIEGSVAANYGRQNSAGKKLP